MGITTSIVVTCDRCSRREELSSSKPPENRWFVIAPMIQAEWPTRYLCGTCAVRLGLMEWPERK